MITYFKGKKLFFKTKNSSLHPQAPSKPLLLKKFQIILILAIEANSLASPNCTFFRF